MRIENNERFFDCSKSRQLWISQTSQLQRIKSHYQLQTNQINRDLSNDIFFLLYNMLKYDAILSELTSNEVRNSSFPSEILKQNWGCHSLSHCHSLTVSEREGRKIEGSNLLSPLRCDFFATIDWRRRLTLRSIISGNIKYSPHVLTERLIGNCLIVHIVTEEYGREDVESWVI